ncbi:hypothetical protein [Paenibacillus segetis]|uniref:DUF4829 domain-containing protein n=1 Tax=Paenibacillus segetis TaxID=1325360 RepID=A0ABQ1Y9W2_9BACL|nr:hypothetical protein [Paenibacillus segetis]GGH16374.1 hypothetical protein GCM10008013_11130 [Paenibacillus segetis]
MSKRWAMFMLIGLFSILMAACNEKQVVTVEAQFAIQGEDQQQIVELIQQHFAAANADDFDEYKMTIFPIPEAPVEYNPVFTIWDDTRAKKSELKKITFLRQDDVGRPRIIADVYWNQDRIMMFSLQKFDVGWKVAGID